MPDFWGCHTAAQQLINWASFVREMFKEYFYRNLRFRKLHGVIEIDESLFGRRVKFHRGNPSRGLKVN